MLRSGDRFAYQPRYQKRKKSTRLPERLEIRLSEAFVCENGLKDLYWEDRRPVAAMTSMRG